MSAALEITGLSKTFKGGVRALDHVDLTVSSGSCFGLLGPNGAGKSTLVKILLSIVKPTDGQAQMLGVDITHPRARAAAGYLPEGHRFPDYLTGRQVCEYFGKLAGLSGTHLKEEVDAKLELVGMKDWGSTKITKYSKGMNQRTGLAQAMLGDPQILFLDEPTDGVDPLGRQEIREVIRKYAESGRCVFLNSHLLSEVEMICDEIAVLHKGQVLRQGRVDAVKESIAGQSQVEIALDSPANEAIHTWLLQRGSSGDDANTYSLLLKDTAELNQVIDHLRAESVNLKSVVPQSASLEDAFIEIIGGQSDQSVGGAQ